MKKICLNYILIKKNIKIIIRIFFIFLFIFINIKNWIKFTNFRINYISFKIITKYLYFIYFY